MSGTRSSGRARSSCSKPQRLIVHRLSRVTDHRLDLNRGDSRDGEASSPGCCSGEGTAPGGSVPAEPVPARHTGQVGGAVAVRAAGPGSSGWRCARCAAGRLWGGTPQRPPSAEPGERMSPHNLQLLRSDQAFWARHGGTPSGEALSLQTGQRADPGGEGILGCSGARRGPAVSARRRSRLQTRPRSQPRWPRLDPSLAELSYDMAVTHLLTAGTVQRAEPAGPGGQQIQRRRRPWNKPPVPVAS